MHAKSRQKNRTRNLSSVMMPLEVSIRGSISSPRSDSSLTYRENFFVFTYLAKWFLLRTFKRNTAVLSFKSSLLYGLEHDQMSAFKPVKTMKFDFG